MITSGRITPALIWVAPFIDAILLSNFLNKLKVFSAIETLPKPSVITIEVTTSSEPVIATPSWYPSNSDNES